MSQISYNLIKQKSLTVVLYKNFLDDDDILAYLTHNEGTSIVAERFIRTIKGKIYIKMITNDNILIIDTSISVVKFLLVVMVPKIVLFISQHLIR